MPTQTLVRNPFPAEAVASYGRSIVTCDQLSYMREVLAEVTNYLTSYPRDESRFGGAVGLQGAHGSGKTHILNWLATTVASRRSIRATVLYAKCDSSNIFDLHRDLMSQLDRPQIIELIQLALLNLARSQVRAARFTESLAERLETPGSLQVLQDEQNIDLEQLRQKLISDLQSSVGATELPRILLDVPDPTFGADAYRWLSAHEIADPSVLGLNHQLRGLSADEANPAGGDPENAAVTAMETIAALHNIAGVPLVILIDQLETLLRTPDRAGFERVTSLLKKFVEQLSRQCAHLYIAGIPEAWNKLPRDVPARFRRREPISVGTLTDDETHLLLKAFTDSLELRALPQNAVTAIHHLSGGNPREILRIAHAAFERTDGQLPLVTEEVVLMSARQTGSIGDRAQLALAAVDSVFAEFGVVSRELALTPEDGTLADRVLRDPHGEILAALVLIRATDPLDEIDSARRVQSVRKYRDLHWPEAELIVVSVGYSSEEVRELVQRGAIVLAFNEKTFEGSLRAHLVSLAERRNRATHEAPAPVDAGVAEALAEIAERLHQLEMARVQEAERAQEEFASGTRNLARPEIEARELRTRWEVLGALDSLDEALHLGDSDLERKIVRSVLIANETYLHNKLLEELGEYYVDALVLERQRGWDPFSGPPHPREARVTMLVGMRRALRRPSGLSVAARYAPLAALACLTLFVATGILSVSTMGAVDFYLFLPRPVTFVSALPYAFLGLAVVAVYIWFVERLRMQSYVRDFSHLIGRPAGESLERSSVRRQYPQA